MNRAWYSYQTWKIDCSMNTSKGTGSSWLQTSNMNMLISAYSDMNMLMSANSMLMD